MLSWVGRLVLDWFWGKLAELVKAWWLKITRRNQIKKESGESVVPLKEAKTAEEIDKATNSALGGF